MIPREPEETKIPKSPKLKKSPYPKRTGFGESSV